MTGLFVQTTFTTGDVDSVVTPFGAGCTNILGWPRHYRDKGIEKAVLGGFDPSARKFLKPDELTFTVPLTLYAKMLEALPDSMFNCGGAWQNVRKKVDRSAKAWGEIQLMVMKRRLAHAGIGSQIFDTKRACKVALQRETLLARVPYAFSMVWAICR